MGYRDSQMLLSEAQAETATGDQESDNVYDQGVEQDGGVGEPLKLLVKVNTTFTSAGAPTLIVGLQTSVDNSTWTDLVLTKTFALAALVAGVKLMELTLPNLGNRYLRVVYRIGVTTYTAGSFDAWFQKDVQNNTPYASGFTV